MNGYASSLSRQHPSGTGAAVAGKSYIQQTHDNAFIQGVALALSIIQSAHDKPSLLAEVLRATCLDRRKMKRAGVDDYDLDVLRPVFAELK